MASSYDKHLSVATKDAEARLDYAAHQAGIIEPDEWIEHHPGSRKYDDPPQVNVRGPRGVRPLGLMPEFTHSTRGREVVAAMEAAASTLRTITKMGALPLDK